MKRELKEEIKRIKSLFNEDRLYGNIIKEQRKKFSEYESACQWNPWQCDKYRFIKAKGNAKGNIYNYETLVDLDADYEVEIISKLSIVDDNDIKDVMRWWKPALEGEYLSWESTEWGYFEKGFNKLDDDHKDLVNVSRVILSYPGFIDKLESNFGTDRQDDRADFYKYFVKFLVDLPYAHTKGVEEKKESDTEPPVEGEAQKTFGPDEGLAYRKWVQGHIAAFKEWDERKQGGKMVPIRSNGEEEENKEEEEGGNKNNGSAWKSKTDG